MRCCVWLCRSTSIASWGAVFGFAGLPHYFPHWRHRMPSQVTTGNASLLVDETIILKCITIVSLPVQTAIKCINIIAHKCWTYCLIWNVISRLHQFAEYFCLCLRTAVKFTENFLVRLFSNQTIIFSWQNRNSKSLWYPIIQFSVAVFRDSKKS